MSNISWKKVIEWRWLINRILVFFFTSIIFSIFLGDLLYGLAVASAFTMILIVDKIYKEGYYIEYHYKDLE
jgi:hypothetical protein